MKKENIDILRSLATGKDSRVDITEDFREQMSKEADNFTSTLSHLPQKQQFDQWKKWSKDKDIDPEYKWTMDEKLYPGTDFRSKAKDSIARELNSKRSIPDKATFLFAEFAKWPSWLRDTYKSQAEAFIPYNKQAEVADVRKLAIFDTKGTLSKIKNNIFPTGTKTTNAHVRALEKGFRLGYTTEIATDSNGDLSVPIKGKLVPLYTISEEDYPTNTPFEDWVQKRDIEPILKEFLSPLVQQDKADLASAQRVKNRKLFNSLSTNKDMKDFELDIIQRASDDELDVEGTAMEGLRMLSSRDVNSTSSSFDAAAKLIDNADKLGRLFDRRKLDA